MKVMEIISAKDFRKNFRQAGRVINLSSKKTAKHKNFKTTVNPNNPLHKNKTEARYERDILTPLMLAGEIKNYYFNKTKFRISKRCWYTVDYLVVLDSCCKLIDVKGMPATDDSLVKIKTAAELFPDFVWVFTWFDKKENEWVERVF